jgi:hypothetical protein
MGMLAWRVRRNREEWDDWRAERGQGQEA